MQDAESPTLGDLLAWAEEIAILASELPLVGTVLTRTLLVRLYKMSAMEETAWCLAEHQMVVLSQLRSWQETRGIENGQQLSKILYTSRAGALITFRAMVSTTALLNALIAIEEQK